MPEPVTVSGLYELAPDVYHATELQGMSLSQSRAKLLIGDGGPARLRHYDTAPREQSPAFDAGTTAHALILGKGLDRLAVLDFPDFRTKAAQGERNLAYMEGKTPVLRHQIAASEDMAAELAKNRQAVELLTGTAEVAAFYRDEPRHLWLRGQMDIHQPGAHITDLKTCVDASERGFERAIWKFRYYLQAAWYRRLVRWLTGENLPYYIVAQEKTAPYLSTVWQVSDEYLDLGERHMDDAVAVYLECVKRAHWPGYDPAIRPAFPPDWATEEVELVL